MRTTLMSEDTERGPYPASEYSFQKKEKDISRAEEKKMQNPNHELTDAARKKFSKFRELSSKHGEKQACETLLERFFELQKQRMVPLLAKPTLAKEFRLAPPLSFNAIGMKMDVVDISSENEDTALEIRKILPTPYRKYRKYGFETPFHVLCEMDIEASRRAFPRK